jgi:hypothetical protein
MQERQVPPFHQTAYLDLAEKLSIEDSAYVLLPELKLLEKGQAII